MSRTDRQTNGYQDGRTIRALLARDPTNTPMRAGAGKLGRSKLGLGKIGSGKVGRWFCAEAVNSVETLSDPKTFVVYIGLLFGPNCN